MQTPIAVDPAELAAILAELDALAADADIGHSPTPRQLHTLAAALRLIAAQPATVADRPFTPRASRLIGRPTGRVWPPLGTRRIG